MVFPPHHETLPHVTKDNWRELAAQKNKEVYGKFPKDWLLPKGKYDDLVNVLGVPAECGILAPLELKITAIDDAKSVRGTTPMLKALGMRRADCDRHCSLLHVSPTSNIHRFRLPLPTVNALPSLTSYVTVSLPVSDVGFNFFPNTWVYFRFDGSNVRYGHHSRTRARCLSPGHWQDHVRPAAAA